ncbi:hypothetical protein HMPREF1146_2450 [Prevotella sp. MSX73]|nr:hypothetical protein HMPREF1146_2450 [Prevotella sp. MSX73]
MVHGRCTLRAWLLHKWCKGSARGVQRPCTKVGAAGRQAHPGNMGLRASPNRPDNGSPRGCHQM